MNNGKKMDIILMNPPYAGSLHLKFLEKAIQISEKVVSVQPVSWLQNINIKINKTSDYNKYENTISKHISNLEIISLEKAQNIFKAGFNTDIAIYLLDNNGGYNYKDIIWNKINKKDFDLFYNSAQKFPDLVEYDENTDKAFVSIKTFANIQRTTRYNIVSPNTYKVIYNKKLPNGEKWNTGKYNSKSLSKEKPMGIYFNTYNEAINFYNSCLTECYKYIVSIFKQGSGIPLKFLPFMNNYKEPWTNERFFSYYKINKSKQIEIIDKMKPYMNKEDIIKNE